MSSSSSSSSSSSKGPKPSSYPKYSLLVVCLGNICRSPIGEGVLRHLITLNPSLTPSEWKIESRGTSSTHEGEGADGRSISVCKKMGIDISRHVAKQLSKLDFSSFDYILAMDKNNLKNINSLLPCPSANKQSIIKMYRHDFEDIDDPYLGEEEDFIKVYDLCMEHGGKWLEECKTKVDEREKEKAEKIKGMGKGKGEEKEEKSTK